MKRAIIIGVSVLCLFAETNRDAYRTAYREWREADPNLERDSGAGGSDFASRVNAVASRAAKYGIERGSFIRKMQADLEHNLGWLESPVRELQEPTRGVRENVASETAVVRRNLETFSNDPDPGIQQLRAALDRESQTLASLANAVAERQSAADAAKSAAAAAEQARLKAGAEEREAIGALQAAAEQAGRESANWAEYYRKLAEAARGEAAPVPATTTAVPSSPAGGISPPAMAPASVPPAPKVITPLPLSRYTGAWTFPDGGLSHGPQPQFLDLVVHEENGHASGTLFARFKVPAGSKDDPVLRFDFTGEFRNSRNQVFALETSDGAKGTIELIPGPAFNLLEVNFLTDAKPGKIRQGNVVLVKK